MRTRLWDLVLAAPLALGVWGLGRAYVDVAAAEGPAAPADAKSGGDAVTWTTAVTPKPLNAGVRKGLDWLVKHQREDGGWSQGEESANMRGGESLRDRTDVADTCIAALALLRSGSTPREGPYKEALARAVGYVREHVQASDSQSLAVSDVQGTRVQMKLGPHIDTFLASLLLAEVKGKMADAEGNAAVDLALNKVVEKIKKHQKADGSWDLQQGWAPVLAQSIGGKGLNRARQAGAQVSDELLAKTETFAKNQVDSARVAVAGAGPAEVAGKPSGPVVVGASAGASGRLRAMSSRGKFAAGGGAGSAGVELYSRAANLSLLQDSVNTNATLERDLREKADKAPAGAPVSDQTVKAFARFKAAKFACEEAQTALLGRLDDAAFVSGFGSNGGEEFLSYMNISESLVLKGGRDWTRWDDSMAGNLGRVQNEDGSWSGNHCITGRTFCTSTALLVLMADRTPVPISAKADAKDKDKDKVESK